MHHIMQPNNEHPRCLLPDRTEIRSWGRCWHCGRHRPYQHRPIHRL